MATCPCCGEVLSASAELGELCSGCTRALESSDGATPGPASPDQMALTAAAEDAAREPTQPEAAPLPKPPYPITKVLLTVNLVAYVLMTIGVHLWPNSDVLHWGADWGPLSLNGQWWRLLTATFMHFSLGHLLSNLLFLWLLGKRLEPILGKWVFPLFYLTCGLAGSIGGLVFHPDQYRCGASGAVFGLAGGLIGVYGVKGLTLSKRARWKLALLIAWTAYSVYPDDATPEIDNAAHAAGLVAGLVLGALLSSRFVATTERRRRLFAAMAGVLLAGAVSVRLYHREVLPLGTAARYLHAGRLDDALRELNALLRQKPDNLPANVLAAETYLEKNELENAEAAARHAMTIDPLNDRAIDVLGIVEFRTGRCVEAYILIGTMVVRNRKAHLHFIGTDCNQTAAGDRYLSTGDAESAIEAYQKALVEKPDDSRALSGLSKAYRVKGMKKEAGEADAAAKAAQMHHDAPH